MSSLPTVLILITIGISQTPSPAIQPKNPVVQNGPSSTAAEAGSTKIQRQSAPSNRQSDPPPTTPNIQTEADNDQKDSGNRIYKVDVVSQPPSKDTRAFLVYVWLTGIGTAVNTFIFLAILRQTKINWRQVKINIRAARAVRTSARAAVTSADAAQKTIGSLERQLVEMEKTANAAKKSADALVNAERAWVDIRIERTSNDRFRCWFINYGKTPASILEAGWIFVAVESLNKLPDKLGMADMPSLLGPNDPHEFANFTVYDLGENFPPILSGNKMAVLYGIVNYVDVLSKSKCETSFCHVYDPKRQQFFMGPPEYNEHN